MRKLIVLCGATAVALSLSACATDNGYGYSTSSRCERIRDNNAVAGGLAGAAIGALAGSAIAGNNSNTEGAIIGGVAGAAIGSQVAKGRQCPPGYYAYDPRYDGGRY